MCALPNLYGEHFREIMQSLAQHSAVSTGAMKVMGYILHMKWIFFFAPSICNALRCRQKDLGCDSEVGVFA